MLLSAIISSIFSMSASSRGATEAVPALLTSIVILKSSRSFVSTFARSILLLRSATIAVMWRPLAREARRERFEGCLAAAYENEIVSTLCETVCIASPDAPRGTRYQGGAF
jgi:hypothetical protein